MPTLTPNATTAAEQLTLFAECDVVPMGDGSFKAIPRKPVIEVAVAKAVKITGTSRDTIYRLYAAGLIRGKRPSPRKIVIDVESLRAHNEASRDPEYWTPERKKAFYGQK